MAGNYPPGTSAGDPRAPWNAPDHSHDHEWKPIKRDYPIFEDGAAIFWEECRYVEGRWNDSWQCEETRTFRYELHSITKVRENQPDIEYLSTTEDRNQWRHIEYLIEDALITINQTHPNDIEFIGCDPPGNRGGVVTVRVKNYILQYRE